MSKVYACADIKDGGQRLACFDAAVASLKKQDSGGDLSVISREQIRQAEVQAFGSTASLSTVAAAAAGKPAVDQAPDQVTLKVKSITTSPDRRLKIVMENGQVWRQTDDLQVQRLGDGPWTAEIRKAALGSYLMNIDGKRAIRVKRDE